MSPAAQLNRAKAMADRLPLPALTSRWWLTAFERYGAGELRLGDREPDWARLLKAYRKVSAVPGGESEALHEWLSELFLRADRGVPACGEAEFNELAAWFRGSESARRLEMHAWATAALPGGAEASLGELKAGVERGAGRFGSGRVADRLRGLRSVEPAAAPPADGGAGRRREGIVSRWGGRSMVAILFGQRGASATPMLTPGATKNGTSRTRSSASARGSRAAARLRNTRGPDTATNSPHAAGAAGRASKFGRVAGVAASVMGAVPRGPEPLRRLSTLFLLRSEISAHGHTPAGYS